MGLKRLNFRGARKVLRACANSFKLEYWAGLGDRWVWREPKTGKVRALCCIGANKDMNRVESIMVSFPATDKYAETNFSGKLAKELLIGYIKLTE